MSTYQLMELRFFTTPRRAKIENYCWAMQTLERSISCHAKPYQERVVKQAIAGSNK
jgi:hypothetical protein